MKESYFNILQSMTDEVLANKWSQLLILLCRSTMKTCDINSLKKGFTANSSNFYN
jgi:hypothetical protein